MVIFDGPGELFDFMLSDGVHNHFYEIYALDKESALRIGAKWFKESYDTTHTGLKMNCTGLPLSKNF